jgi:hypothetical protein
MIKILPEIDTRLSKMMNNPTKRIVINSSLSRNPEFWETKADEVYYDSKKWLKHHRDFPPFRRKHIDKARDLIRKGFSPKPGIK